MEALGTENSFEARNSLFNALLAQPGLTSFLRTDEGNVTSVAFSPDGKTLAVGYGAGRSDGGVVLWDVTARRRLADEPLTVKVIVNSVAFSPDGKTLAVGGGRGVVLFDLTNRQGIRAKPLTVPGGLVGRVAFSPNTVQRLLPKRKPPVSMSLPQLYS